MKKINLLLIFVIVITLFILNVKAKNLNRVNNKLFLQPTKSTLDSLQGSWKNDEDSNYILKFTHDTLQTIFENEDISSAKVYISQEFIEDENSLKALIYNNNFGTYMVQKDLETNLILCYKIEYMTNNDLTFEYRGRLINFHK